MSKLGYGMLDYIQSEVDRIKYGRVIIECVEHKNSVDVITEERKRFDVEKKNETYHNG